MPPLLDVCPPQDFIIAPSPQVDPWVGPFELLAALVERLEKGGHLDPESSRLMET